MMNLGGPDTEPLMEIDEAEEDIKPVEAQHVGALAARRSSGRAARAAEHLEKHVLGAVNQTDASSMAAAPKA